MALPGLSGDDYAVSIFWPLEEVLIVLTHFFFLRATISVSETKRFIKSMTIHKEKLS